jgi:hypothetical protein
MSDDARLWLKDPASWSNNTSEYIFELETERDRLRTRLAHIAELHTKWASSPYRLPSCAECREPWPCATYKLATSPDLPGDQSSGDAQSTSVAGEPTSTDRHPAAPWDPTEGQER